MNILRKTILLTMIFIGAVNFAIAEDISVTAEVESRTVAIGSPVLLMLIIKGADGVEPVKLPEMKGLQARYLGPRTEISIMNGQSNRSTSFMYNLYALEVGPLEIPAIPVTIGNSTYLTKPIAIEGLPEQENIAKGKVFLTINVPNKEYFINEKIPLTFKLYVADNLQVNLASNIDFKRPGFDIGEVLDSSRAKEIVGGETFDKLEFEAFIYPRQTGDLTLGPAQLLVKILVQNASRRQGRPSIFDDDLFGFLNHEWRELLIKSADITLKVLPVPEEGRPKDFSGGVGKFNFDVSASPTEVQVGDPITLRMRLSGNGSLKNVNFTQFNDARFKFYDPQVHEDQDDKTLEQVVIPTTDQIKEFSAVSFSYFDPETRRYETITKGPFALKVTKDDTAPARMVGSAPEPAAPPAATTSPEEKLGQGISFIKEAPGAFMPRGFYLYKNPVFLSLVFVLVLSWIAAFVGYHITLKFKTDTVFARRFLAPRKAKKDLSEARHHLEKGEQKEFYDRLFKTLQDYLSSKSHQRSAAMTIENIGNILKARGIKPEISNEIRDFLQECEMVRFASVQVSKERMQTNFTKIQEIIDYLERNWS